MNPEEMTAGQGHLQEQGYQRTLADPNADPSLRLAASSALEKKLQPRFYQPAPGLLSDVTTPDQTPQLTQIGQSDVDKNNAAAWKARNPTATGAPTNSQGLKAPTGYAWDPNDDTKLVPIPGGPHDPDNQAPMGSRESTYMNRVLQGAAQSAAAIHNIVQLPSGATTGFVGLGASPGHSVFQATRDAVRNSLSSQDVQTYNLATTGLHRSLATIETQGLVPPGTFTTTMQATDLRPGDTELTKLQKLAELRQIVETGLDPLANSPRVPSQTKQYIGALINRVHDAVPFTWDDVLALSREKDNTTTLADVIKARTGNTPGALHPTAPGVTPAAAGSTPEPKTQQEYDALPSGTVYIDTDGQRKRKR